MVAGQAGRNWLGYNCSIGNPAIELGAAGLREHSQFCATTAALSGCELSGSGGVEMIDWKTSLLGKTNWKVSRLGLASSYGADERCVQMAFERGINYLYWGSMRTAKFGAGLRSLRSRRDEFRLVIQSYSRIAAMVPWSLERASPVKCGLDYALRPQQP